MSYHPDKSVCFPEKAILRMQPRAAGPQRELVTLTGGYERIRVPWNRGLLVIDPRYDTLPLGPVEWRTS